MRGATRLLVAVTVALSSGLTLASPVAADTVITNCTEAGLDSALAAVATGGTITFGCGGTIVIRTTKMIPDHITVALDGSGQQVTLSGGGATGTHQTMFLVPSNATFNLSNLTVSDANVTAGSAGAILNDGNFNVRNVVFINNASSDSVLGGGAIRSSAGNVVISGSTFIGNASLSGGGALAVDFGSATIDSSWFQNNSTQGTGGAIQAGGSGDVFAVTVTKSNFLNNQASGDGGALFIGSVFTVVIDHTTITGNSGFTGGGISQSQISQFPVTNATISASTLSGNQAQGDGGALYVNGINGGTLVMLDSTLASNTAAQHGGAAAGSGASTVEFSNTTIAGNSATLAGGGIYHPSPQPATAVIFFSTILANTQNCVGAVSSRGFNLDADGSCQLTAPTDLARVYPRLGPLQNNGGLTQTMALGVDSPAVDAGPPMTSDPVFTCLPSDQRGIVRPQGPACDIGAFELQKATPTATPTSTATATPSRTATPTPASASMCDPRPNVLLSVVPTGDGRLSVTVRTQIAPGTPQNAISSILFGAATNGLIDAGSALGSSGGFSLVLPPETQTATFTVRRAVPGPVTVPFTVNDRCGAWPTFVGGGASAF